MSRLSANFTLDEMTRSQTATRQGINNMPDAQSLINLVYTAQMMEEVREACNGHAVHVSSGYRCKELNTRIGGSATSHHMTGLAVDFTIPKFGTVEEVAERIQAAGIQYAQLIIEFGRWIHIAAHPLNSGARGATLIASKVNGTTQYRNAA